MTWQRMAVLMTGTQHVLWIIVRLGTLHGAISDTVIKVTSSNIVNMSILKHVTNSIIISPDQILQIIFDRSSTIAGI